MFVAGEFEGRRVFVYVEQSVIRMTPAHVDLGKAGALGLLRWWAGVDEAHGYSL